MSLDWLVSMSTGGCAQYPDSLVNICFDLNILGNSSSTPASNDFPTVPLFTLNTTVACAGNLSSRRYFITPYFRTQSAVTNIHNSRTPQSYPFDWYTANIFMLASSSDGTFLSVGIPETSGVAVGFNVMNDRANPFKGELPRHSLISTFTITRGNVVVLYTMIIIVAIC